MSDKDELNDFRHLLNDVTKSRHIRVIKRRINLVEHLFPWAVEELAKVYADAGEHPTRM